jgi:hypothetical protein
MQRHVILGLLLLTAGLSACSGSGGSMSSTPMTPTTSGALAAGTDTTTVPITGDPTSFAMPMAGGFSGTISLPSSSTRAGATLTVRSSLTAASALPASALRAPQGTGNITVLFFVTFTSPVDITFTSLPGFSLNVEKSKLAAGQAFYALGGPAPGVPASFTTEGPAKVSNTNLSFSPAATNFTLKAGVPQLFEFFENVEASKGNGTFYAQFTGDQRALNALQGTGELSASTGSITLSALMAGPIVDGNTNFYIWGFNRGAATNAPFPGEPNVVFDAVAVITVQPDGTATGAVNLIPSGPVGTIPASAIQINGAKIQISFPSSLLPPTGTVSAAGYVWDLWTRNGVGGPPSQIGSFIPENAMAPFVPAP